MSTPSETFKKFGNLDCTITACVDLGFLLPCELEEARKIAANFGDLGVIQMLVAQGKLTEEDIASVFATQFDFQFTELKQRNIPASTLRVFDSGWARHYRAIPIAVDGEEITIAIDNPANLDTLDGLHHLMKQLQKRLTFVVVAARDIDLYLKKCYPFEQPAFTVEKPEKTEEPRS